MELRELEFGSEGYRRTLDLRRRILREPLGVEWTDDERQAEPVDRHFALLEDGAPLACVVARELGGGRIKFRQMAVEPERQKCGLGRALLEGVEQQLAREGAAQFELNARETAREFYEKLGYRTVGERFLEVGIPHWRMEKVVVGY